MKQRDTIYYNIAIQKIEQQNLDKKKVLWPLWSDSYYNKLKNKKTKQNHMAIIIYMSISIGGVKPFQLLLYNIKP